MKKVEFDFVEESKHASNSSESLSVGRESLPGTVSALLDHTNNSKKNYGYVIKDANVDFVEKEPEPIFASVSTGHHTPTKNVNHDYVKMKNYGDSIKDANVDFVEKEPEPIFASVSAGHHTPTKNVIHDYVKTEEDLYRPMNDSGFFSTSNQLTTPKHPDVAEKIGAMMKSCTISNAKNNDSNLVKAKPMPIFASISAGYQTPLKSLNKDGRNPSKSGCDSAFPPNQEADSESGHDFSSTKNPANSLLVPKADHKAARNFGPGTHQFDFKDVNLQAPKKSPFSPKNKSSLRKHQSQNVNSEVASESEADTPMNVSSKYDKCLQNAANLSLSGCQDSLMEETIYDFSSYIPCGGFSLDPWFYMPTEFEELYDLPVHYDFTTKESGPLKRKLENPNYEYAPRVKCMRF